MAVRQEGVRLSLDDAGFTTGLAKDAAVVAFLRKELDSLGGTSIRTTRSIGPLGNEIDNVTTKARRGGAEIDKYSGRVRLLLDTAAILTPALVSVGAVGIPIIAGLAAEFGSAALAGGTMLLAFQGVGDALKAVNTAALEPTTENLEKARAAMALLSPAARDFVRELQQLRPVIQGLQGSAAAGFFPGLGEALDELTTAAPQVEDILFQVGHALGELSKEGADALTGPEWADFLEFLKTEAPSALATLAKSVGSLTHGLAELAMAGAPLSHEFGDWLLRAASGFNQWAAGLSKTQGYEEFLTYLETNGPKVADAVGAIANALLQILEASAPLGGPILQTLTAVANVIASLADSNAGPTILATVTALAVLSRAQAAFGSVADTSWGRAIKGADTYSAKVGVIARRAAPAAAGLALAASGIADGFGLANTATLALTGSLAGPWGAAVGGAVGLLLDFSSGQKGAVTDTATLTGTLDQQTGAITQNTAAYVAQQFASSGLLKTAQSLGLNLADVTQAALGNADALERVNDQSRAYEASLSGNVPALAAFADDWGDVKGAIGDTSDQLTKGQSRLHLMAEALGTTTAATEDATSATETFTGALDHLNNRLQRRASLRDYQAAIDDFTASMKKNGKSLDIDTEKGRANQAALDKIASTAIQVANNLHGVDKQKFMAQARQDFIDAATKILGTRDAAVKLANQLGVVGKMHVNPKIDADTSQANAAINQITTMLRNLDGRTATTYVRTVRNDIPLPGQSADGGTVPETGLGYADRHPYLLADGEEVISNRHGQADRHRSLLKAINANRLAGGGTAGHNRGGSLNTPLFTSEGPRFYKAAYKHNRPFALDAPAKWDWPYQTGLTQALAAAFYKWLEDWSIPFDPNAKIVDYDMRGFYKKARPTSWTAGQHFPDTFKTPYDTTFSHESKYATKNNPFYWHGDKLVDERTGQVIFAAAGGTVPTTGRGYADRHPYLLADGEEVISNRYGQADRHRSLLKAINANRYADGGTAGKPDPSDPSNKKRHQVTLVLSPELAVLVDRAGSLGRALKALEQKVKDNQKAFDKEKQKRDDLASAMGSVASAVAGRFDVDLSGGGSSSSPWSSTSVNSSVSGQIAAATQQAQALPGIIAALQQAGLSGPALAQALQQMSFSQLQQLSSNPGEAASLGQSLGALYTAQQAAGSAAGSAAYGAAYAAQQKVAMESRDELRLHTHELHEIKAVLDRIDQTNKTGHAATAAAAGSKGGHSAGAGRRGVGPR